MLDERTCRYGPLLNDGLRHLRTNACIGLAVSDLSFAAFTPKDAGDSEGNIVEVIPSGDSGPESLDLYQVRKVEIHERRPVLEANDLAVPVVRCGAFKRLRNLWPPTRWRIVVEAPRGSKGGDDDLEHIVPDTCQHRPKNETYSHQRRACVLVR